MIHPSTIGYICDIAIPPLITGAREVENFYCESGRSPSYQAAQNSGFLQFVLGSSLGSMTKTCELCTGQAMKVIVDAWPTRIFSI